MEDDEQGRMEVDSTRPSAELWQDEVHDWELRSNARRESTAGGKGRPSSRVQARLRSLPGMGGGEDEVVEMREVSRGELMKRRKTATRGPEFLLGGSGGEDQLGEEFFFSHSEERHAWDDLG